MAPPPAPDQRRALAGRNRGKRRQPGCCRPAPERGSGYGSFAEFWPFYLAQHSKPATRRWHFLGSTLGLACLLLLVITGRWWYLGVGLALGYGLAWVGHFFFEKNRPATFTYPLYSFAGDWKMYFLMLSGRLEAELRRLSQPVGPA